VLRALTAKRSGTGKEWYAAFTETEEEAEATYNRHHSSHPMNGHS
jgi:hypothetical protein